MVLFLQWISNSSNLWGPSGLFQTQLLRWIQSKLSLLLLQMFNNICLEKLIIHISIYFTYGNRIMGCADGVRVIGAESEIRETSSNCSLILCVYFALYPCEKYGCISSLSSYELNNKVHWALQPRVAITLKSKILRRQRETTPFQKIVLQFPDNKERKLWRPTIIYILKGYERYVYL